MNMSVVRLKWAVKDSFLEYVRGLPDGALETFGGCQEHNGAFEFPGESAGDGLSFTGGIRFSGFGGILDVRLADPMIEGDAEGHLTTLVGPKSIAARTAIARFEGVPPVPGQPWSVTPTLTFEGVRVLGDVYQVGTALAPLSVFAEPR